MHLIRLVQIKSHSKVEVPVLDEYLIPILGGGTVFFIVLVPSAFFRKRP